MALVRAGVPRALSAAIDRCLAREPSARFASGEALADALDGDAAPPIPPVLRRLAGEISEGTVDITGFATLAIVAGITQSLTRDFFGFGFVYTLSLVTLMIGLLGLRGLLVTRLAREAMAEGWQARDLERAVEREARERSERAPAPPLGRRFVLYLVGLVALTLLWLGPKQWAQGDFSGVLPWVIELVSLAVPVALGRWLGAALEAPRDGKPGLLTRAFLRFKGALIFRAASMGLKHRTTPARLDDRPTEVVLAGAARDLLRALPAPERDRMHDAGPLVEELEATATIAAPAIGRPGCRRRRGGWGGLTPAQERTGGTGERPPGHRGPTGDRARGARSAAPGPAQGEGRRGRWRRVDREPGRPGTPLLAHAGGDHPDALSRSFAVSRPGPIGTCRPASASPIRGIEE